MSEKFGLESINPGKKENSVEEKNDEAKKLAEQAKDLRVKAKTPEDYDKLAKLYKGIERLYSPQELSSSLQKQYETQTEFMQNLGILETLKSGDLGIKGIDGKEYALPTQEEITERIEANKELLERKQEQGFTKFLLVPFGIKLDELIGKYRQVILTHHKEGKLLATKKDPSDPDEPLDIRTEEEDADKAVWVWEEYKNADIDGRLVYQPKEFSKKHGGKTKQEILAEQGAWQVLLIEDMPNIPRKDKGKIVGGRKQFETYDTPNNYLKTLQESKSKKDSPYQGEEGMTPESQLMYAITHLEETDQVIDDYQKNGSVSYQIGAYFPGSGYAPSAYWDRDYRQAYLGGSGPDDRSGGCSVRPAVRIQ